jgi:uncharacterized membrane protein YqaE (UPF0057 family)
MRKLITHACLLLLTCFIIATSTQAALPVSTEPVPKEAVIANAVNEFKELKRSERKMRIKEAKKELKKYKASKKDGNTSKKETDQTLLIILCILLPPLAVYLKEEEINSKFWISLLLTLLFWLPGVIYALLVVLGEV